MLTSLPLSLLLLPIAFSAPSGKIGVRSPEPLRIPLTAHASRQYHPDLEVRSDWLKDQAKALKNKYKQHLTPESRALVEREQVEDRLRKRTEGSVQCVFSQELFTPIHQLIQIRLVDIGIDASYSGQVSIG